MVLAAYLAGVLTPVAAVLAGYGGHWWWARLRRAQAATEADVITGATVLPMAPAPPPPQDEIVTMGRVRTGVNVPGRRRALRGHRPRGNG